MPNIDGISITLSAVIKDLGVALDLDLALNTHIKNISKVFNRVLPGFAWMCKLPSESAPAN